MKVSAIIQARMNSTRLPGKILMEVMERPLLSYQIERLRFCKTIDDIFIATTMSSDDDQVEDLAQKEGLITYRGSEEDVLDRYYQTAKKYNVKHIMRITADCPFIQPDICDKIVSHYFDSGVDYVCTGETYAEGLDCEVLSLEALSQAWRDAVRRSEREHVCMYIGKHPEKFRFTIVENEIDDSKYRLTLDEHNDFLVVKAIIENLYKGPENLLTLTEIKEFLVEHPDIYYLNSHIIRNEGLLKSIEQDKRN